MTGSVASGVCFVDDYDRVYIPHERVMSESMYRQHERDRAAGSLVSKKTTPTPQDVGGGGKKSLT